MRKTILLALLVLLALALPLTAGAESSGACGENVTWTLDGNGLLTISGTGAMYDFDWNGAPWYSERETIETVQIENGVTSIGEMAFYSCPSLTNVTIPSGVTAIRAWAFSDCYSLTGVTIPSGVITIGDFAFSYCTSLTGVTIPAGVAAIGEFAFSDCCSLVSIQVESGNATYASENGVLFNKDRTILIACPGGKTGAYVIPNSVTSIEDSAFSGCSNLTSVTIPSGVTSIGDAAFYGCTSLVSLQAESGNATYASVDGILFNKNRTTLLMKGEQGHTPSRTASPASGMRRSPPAPF